MRRVSHTVIYLCALELIFWLTATTHAASVPAARDSGALATDRPLAQALTVPDSSDEVHAAEHQAKYIEAIARCERESDTAQREACIEAIPGSPILRKPAHSNTYHPNLSESRTRDETPSQNPRKPKDGSETGTKTSYDAFTEHGIFCQGGLLTSWGLSAVGSNFLATWVAFTVLALISVSLTSGPLFYYYYWPSQVTYEKWTRKSNPKFPSPEKVRDEITQMTKCVFCTALCPAASVWLAFHGYGQAYCGAPDDARGTFGYFAATFALVMLLSDFWEFFYHWLGHKFKFFWEQHKHHHVFFNPSPFAVIADEFVDQFVRAGPLLLFPLLAPINIDLMFVEYAVFFYCYGCYLHWGYELDYPDAHHPIMNTAFQHYCHHAKAIIGKPYHCGFFFKIWDDLFGSVYKGDCFCVKCQRAQGLRSREKFAEVKIPDYTVLATTSFWFKDRNVLSGTSAKDSKEKEK